MTYTPTPTPTPKVTLTLQGGQLVATDEDNHSVFLPLDVNGLRVLKNMLYAKTHLPKRFATATQPVQQMVEKFMKDKAIKKEMELAEANEELKEMF